MEKKSHIGRREFLQAAAVGAASAALGRKVAWSQGPGGKCAVRKPNLVYIFADQWRAQAAGYAGDSNATTPSLDKLAEESINFTNAVSGEPSCSPYRASLMTGRYPLTHGIFLNNLCLSTNAVSIAQAYNRAGYETGYIGKWHLGGPYRSAFTPKERRQGFKFWRALECTHKYNNSFYYADENVKLKWQGYDAIAQTSEARRYIREHADGKPFALFLSWGPPHNPYHTAPEKYKDLYENKELKLRPNVPRDHEQNAQKDLRGYYAHIAVLDDCVGRLLQTLKQCGLEKNTILVFTSDHGDMHGSQGQYRKSKPWDESIKVPFLLRYPAALGRAGRAIDMPINTPDIMPTLLGLSGIEIPDTVEGADFSGIIRAAEKPRENAALITSPTVHIRMKHEFRGVRTSRYTYVRSLKGPWLLYDNKQDPYQLNNLCDKPEHAELQKKLESILSQKLKETNDEFLPGREYIEKWGYKVGKNGSPPYFE